MSARFCRYCHGKFVVSDRGFTHHEAHCEANPNRKRIPTPHELAKRYYTRRVWVCTYCQKPIRSWWRTHHQCQQMKAERHRTTSS